MAAADLAQPPGRGLETTQDAAGERTRLWAFPRLRRARGAVALTPVLAWTLRNVLLMGFGAALIAVFLHVVSEPFQRWTPLPDWAALLIAALIVLGLLGATGWVFGAQISSEFDDVLKQTHAGLTQLQRVLDQSDYGRFILGRGAVIVGGRGGAGVMLVFLLLWVGMIVGAATGATAYQSLGLNSVAIAALAFAILAALTRNMVRSQTLAERA